jgi:ubiquitin-activating enzyme E1
VNELCRSKGIGFILSQTYGPAGFAFVDFGNDFTIFDTDGEDTQSCIIENISQTNPMIVRIQDGKRHPFQDGDHVKFSEV